MAHLYGERIRIPIPRGRPLRLRADGEACETEDWVVSLVRFSRSGARSSWAALARDGADLRVGSRRVAAVAALEHGDHLFVGRTELVFSSDALPELVDDAGAGAVCPLCLAPTGEEGRGPLRECPGCGLRGCERCFRDFVRACCPTCGGPASLDRPLWEPARNAFVTREEEDETP